MCFQAPDRSILTLMTRSHRETEQTPDERDLRLDTLANNYHSELDLFGRASTILGDCKKHETLRLNDFQKC
jgi:hypothetical protein